MERREKELTVSVSNRAEQLKQKLQALEEKENIRLAREHRVPVEPDRLPDSIDVVVQHVEFGRIQRPFSPNESMQVVYDLAGSLSHEPTYLKLCRPFSHDAICPEMLISVVDKMYCT